MDVKLFSLFAKKKATAEAIAGMQAQIVGLINGAGIFAGYVDKFADLPAPADYNTKIWVVKTASGIPLINRKESGLYFSDGASWNFLDSSNSELAKFTVGADSLVTSNLVIEGSDVAPVLDTAAGKLMLGLSEATRTALNDAAAHKADTANPHAVTKEQVGLGNVDNTADADKPVPDSVVQALAGKQDKLASGTTIKTINQVSLLGSGNLIVGSIPPANIDISPTGATNIWYEKTVGIFSSGSLTPASAAAFVGIPLLSDPAQDKIRAAMIVRCQEFLRWIGSAISENDNNWDQNCGSWFSAAGYSSFGGLSLSGSTDVDNIGGVNTVASEYFVIPFARSSSYIYCTTACYTIGTAFSAAMADRGVWFYTGTNGVSTLTAPTSGGASIGVTQALPSYQALTSIAPNGSIGLWAELTVKMGK